MSERSVRHQFLELLELGFTWDLGSGIWDFPHGVWDLGFSPRSLES